MKEPKEILRGLREDRDIKQSEIASLINTTQQQYSKYENGESELPVRALVVLADYYGVSTDYLLGRTECREGVDGMNQTVIPGCTIGSFITDVISLENQGRASVVEYVGLQKIKEKCEKK